MLATGVFRRLVHLIDNTTPIEFAGIPLWFARCGAACVPLEGAPNIDRNQCPICACVPTRRRDLCVDQGQPAMTADLPADIPVFWGHGVIEPNCAHARETLAGQPVTDQAEDGSVMGFAICGCLLIADVTDEQVASGDYWRCSRCMELLVNRKPGVDYPLWTSG